MVPVYCSQARFAADTAVSDPPSFPSLPLSAVHTHTHIEVETWRDLDVYCF